MIERIKRALARHSGPVRYIYVSRRARKRMPDGKLMIQGNLVLVHPSLGSGQVFAFGAGIKR